VVHDGAPDGCLNFVHRSYCVPLTTFSDEPTCLFVSFVSFSLFIRLGLFVSFCIIIVLSVSRLAVVRAGVVVACYLAVLFRKCTSVMEYCAHCNDAFL